MQATLEVTHTQWCKFMSKNLIFAPEISRGGRGRTRVGGATKKRAISLLPDSELYTTE